MFKIEDVVDAIPVHFWCGLWGVVATGLYADDDLVRPAYAGMYKDDAYGAFMGGDGKQLGMQLLAAVIVTAWL